MKTKSLCFRLTVMTAMILLLCSIALTLSASYNAGKQLSVVADAASPNTTIVLTPIEGDDGSINTPTVRGINVTAAQRDFNLAGLASLLVISILGTGAVYFSTKRTLQPIHNLSEQVAAITENNLDERVSGGERKDEVGMLCRSFNVMLERLGNSFSMQKRFSANVAHELKTPLATMQASVQVMRLGQTPTPDECERMLDTIERNTGRLRSIIEDLMRLCNEQEQFEKNEIPLSELFSAIFAELTRSLAEKHIQTEIDCTEYPTVIGNYGLLYRALFNLVENAVKYNREGGSITISSSIKNNIGEICIKDTGNGIPQEELPLIFEPFYRVNKSRSRKTGGAGLGLAVAKTIIERHGWSITVESAMETGTEIVIHLYKS